MSDKEFNDYRDARFSAYCTNDVYAAERTLLGDLQTLSEWESNRVEGTDFKIDYDARKALDHEGLFLIYRKTHETNKMEFEFQQSMDYMAQSRHNAGETPPPSITYDEFARELEMREQKANVRWKTNAISSLSP